MKIILTTILIINLITSAAIADDEGEKSVIDSTTEEISNYRSGKYGVSKRIAKPLSNLIIKKAGTPGFLISKYLSYSKQMQQPICTMSEKVNRVSYLLTLTSDITNHVVSWKNSKDLKKEFKSSLKELEKYSKDNKIGVSKDEILPTENRDIHLRTMDLQIKRQELELKRLKLYKTIKYPALALFLTSQVLTIQEMFAESGSMGSVSAAEEACRSSQKPGVEAKKSSCEAKADALMGKVPSKVESEVGEAPWYLKPFVWIGEKLDVAHDFLKEGAENLVNVGDKSKDKKSTIKLSEEKKQTFIDECESSSYAEEMIISVIEEFKGSKKKGIKGKIKEEIGDLGIRVMVKKLVRTNREAIDKFMRSAIGRYVVIGQNVYIIYKDFDSIEAQIKYAKNKKEILEHLKNKYTGVVSSNNGIDTIYFNKYKDIFKMVLRELAPDLLASINVDRAFQELKLCIDKDFCSGGSLINKNIGQVMSKYPDSSKKEISNLIKNSYTLRQFINNQKNNHSLLNFNMNKITADILAKEKYLEEINNVLISKKYISKDVEDRFIENTLKNDYNLYASYLRPGFNTQVFSNKEMQLTIENEKNETVSNIEVQQVKKTDVAVKEVEKSKQYRYNNMLNSKDVNIWQVIHSRYQKKFDLLLDK